MAFTRRRLLASAGAGGLAAAAGSGCFALGRETASDDRPASQVVDFFGEHQAGIATPAQDRLHFAAFDVEEGLRAADLRELLRAWSHAAARMTTGEPVGEVWDRASLGDQDQTIGRHKASGAPLGGRDEFDEPDLARLPVDSHVRLAAPSSNAGIALLRRGYSFTDGLDDRLGQLDAGLFFLSFQRDPDAFVRVQRRLGTSDALNEYIKHVGSGVWAIPPGARPGSWVGETLLGSSR
jgi:deferrochelatase/peroxidase EfeB